ncbi:hypothetical protein N657DRAFT_674277 [Parathielavia appendiculata]|uniref:Uncharacterized protein n=1 Tax=Parathielavia appendiculata TaxID=2587402 RepID=A0AAN6TTC1_9PEZI|nr:hypothetical protein N657DRAFT_674277 [Parathielavia appendiculata]
MLIVAVAGGTGHLGLTIVEVFEEIRDTECEPSQSPRLKSTTQTSTQQPSPGQQQREHHHLSPQPEDSRWQRLELQLVAAAAQSSTTKRFMGSDWAIPYPLTHAFRIFTLSALRATEFEWTCLHVGQIADYLGTPHLPGHMSDVRILNEGGETY